MMDYEFPEEPPEYEMCSLSLIFTTEKRHRGHKTREGNGGVVECVLGFYEDPRERSRISVTMFEGYCH